MADISNHDLRKKLDSQLNGLKALRSPYEEHWEQISKYEQARVSRFVRSQARSSGDGSSVAGSVNSLKKGWANTKLYNARAVTSSQVLGNGMSAGLCSPSQPWFKLQPDDPDMLEYAPVKEWLAQVQRQIYDLLARCGFYPAATSGFLELGLFGTQATVMIPHWEYGAACFQLENGSYWIGQNDAGRVDTLYREIEMTVAQMYARWPEGNFSKRVRDAHDKGDHDTLITVCHGVEPNDERVYGKLDKTNLAYRSVYWEPNTPCSDGVIEFGGFHERPFWAPRWQNPGSSVYGMGPGMMALPSARKLQLLEIRKQQAMDYIVKPPMAFASGATTGNVQLRLNPGEVTNVTMSDRPVAYPLWQVDVNAVGLISEDISKTEQEVDISFYADLFKAFTNMSSTSYKSIEEIARKHEEQLTQLGPVTDQAGSEMLDPVIEQAFAILNRAGMLPPPPEEMQGQELGVHFDGVLAQAQRMIGLGAIERTAGFVGNLIAVNPSVGDKLDWDQMVDEYSTLAGAPPKMIRSGDDVAKIRESRAQAEQQQKMMEAAPALQAGADAAKLLSETDLGNGRSALQALTLAPGV